MTTINSGKTLIVRSPFEHLFFKHTSADEPTDELVVGEVLEQLGGVDCQVLFMGPDMAWFGTFTAAQRTEWFGDLKEAIGYVNGRDVTFSWFEPHPHIRFFVVPDGGHIVVTEFWKDVLAWFGFRLKTVRNKREIAWPNIHKYLLDPPEDVEVVWSHELHNDYGVGIKEPSFSETAHQRVLVSEW